MEDSPVNQFALTEEFITLGQLLKLVGLIATGGEVKYFLMERGIKVNGVYENRRGRKLYAGDKIAVEGETSIVLTRDGATAPLP